MSGAGDQMAMVTDHEGVRTVLRDRRLSPRSFTDDMIAAGMSRETAEQLTPLFRRDGDDHRNHRSLLAAAFTPRNVERLRPVAADVATRLANDLVAAGDGADFDALFAAPLPPEVFAVLFGLPVEDRDRLAGWAAALAAAFFTVGDLQIVQMVETAAAEMRDYCATLIAERRARPADDLVTRLMDAEIDGLSLDDRDLTAIITAFIFAGSETTRRQLAAMMGAFADHPDAWDRVGREPALIPNAVEEVLRARPIVPGLTRMALEPFNHEGAALEAGDRLAVVFLSANMDPAAFDEPHRFDITRENADTHLTFGWGPHFCVGAGLARVELQESLRALLRRGLRPAAS